MALYADENFPLRVVEGLRQMGHDVLTALEDGKANQSVTDQESDYADGRGVFSV
jgi:hypothetical protein